MKLPNECPHKYNNGKSAVAFITNRWRGIYPKQYNGICSLCQGQIKMTHQEYLDFMKEGENRETNF